MGIFFFFKQKTAYEMRISDWSSDVCSSDLNLPDGAQPQMGPVTTGLGEVVMYTVGYKNPDGKGAKKVAGQPGWQPDGSDLTPEGDILTDEIEKTGYLRTVKDWIVSTQLNTVGGVAGVDSTRSQAKTIVAEPAPTPRPPHRNSS